MDSKTNKVVKHIKTGLINSETKEEINKWSLVIREILVSFSTKPQDFKSNSNFSNSNVTGGSEAYFESLEYDRLEVIAIQRRIAASHYLSCQLYDVFIQKFSIDWMSQTQTQTSPIHSFQETGSNSDHLNSMYFHNMVKSLFLEGPVTASFLSISHAITVSSKKDFRFHTCVSLLEKMLTTEKLTELLQAQCHVNKDDALQCTGIDDATTNELVTALASLPEKMANRLLHDNSEKFYPSHYIPMLSMAILRVLDLSQSALASGQDVSLHLISALVGKLCLSGAAELFLDTVLPQMCAKVRASFVWSRVCVRVFTGGPPRCMEAVVIPLLRKIPWYGLVEKLLGDYVVENTSAKMLICTKLLLYKHFSNAKLLLQNIVGYLCDSPTRHHLYLKVFMNLLEVWGSPTSMRHISGEQHHYISKALMVCVGALSEHDVTNNKDEFLRLLMPGVQAHLESSEPQVRLSGMTVAKRLTHRLDPSGPQLEFDLDMSNAMVSDLLSYEGLPDDPGPSTTEIITPAQDEEITAINGLEQNLTTMKLEGNAKDVYHGSEDLDSDDDLVAYDMSNDQKVKDVKPPKYLRECMEGLICSTDNLEKAELCLCHAEAIIRKNTDGLEEIAAEFAKILLHMSDSHGIDGFLKHRRKAMVALTVMCPKEVADYLTSQFYERNYNLRQRMDVLEVLAEAATELSHPEKMKQHPERGKLIVEVSPSSEPASWREVVQKRIESNTRRFAKGQIRPVPLPQLNRFASVAGHFFYPLLVKVDRREPCLDLLGQDSALLFRLLYTLAIVVHAAANLPAVTQMGRTLLEFTWSLRLHPDQCVRQAVLIDTTTVFLSVPAHSIMSDLHTDICETMTWLEDVIEKDADTECQKMAAQALLILQEQMKKDSENKT